MIKVRVENLDDVPEALKPHYQKVGNDYVLQLDGAPSPAVAAKPRVGVVCRDDKRSYLENIDSIAAGAVRVE